MKDKIMKRTSGRPKPLGRRPLPRRQDVEIEKRNGDSEEKKSGLLIKRIDGSVTEIKRLDGPVTEMNGRVAPEDVQVTSPVKQTSPSRYSTTSKLCRSCGVYHCHSCDKCMSGLEPYEQHMKSDKHLKKARDLKLLELAAEERNKMALAAKEPSWKKCTETGCSFPGCTHHCTVCDRHLTGLSAVEGHFESAEHASALDVRSKAPVAVTTKVTDLWTGKSIYLNEVERGTTLSEATGSAVPTTSRVAMKTDSVAMETQSGTSSTQSVAMADSDHVAMVSEPSNVTFTEISSKVDVVSASPAQELFPDNAKSSSKSFSDGIVFNENMNEQQEMADVEFHEPQDQDTESDSYEDANAEIVEPISLTPFTDLLKGQTPGMNIESRSESPDVKATSNDSTVTMNGDVCLESSNRETRSVDTRQSQDLSAFDDGGALYDISLEPDPVPKTKAKNVSGKLDYEWLEGGLKVDLPDVRKVDEGIMNDESGLKESEERWRQFMEERGEVPKPPAKQIISRSRFEPVSVTSKPAQTPSSSASGDAPFHSNCSYPGCAFHCTACEAHCSGPEPRRQHELSAMHRKIVENTQRIQEETCNFPGCAYHCVVCDMHLTGRGPRDQHLLSAKHVKKAKAKGLQVNDSPSPPTIQNYSPTVTPSPEYMNPSRTVTRPSPSFNYSPPIGASASCGLDFCYHHCHPCNIHLSGPEPRDQHLQSVKHRQRQQQTIGFSSTPALQTVSRTVTSTNDDSLYLSGLECFVDCPDDRPSCTAHCKVCKKHFCGAEPKFQHAKSEKHLRAVLNYVRNGERSNDIVTTDGIEAGTTAGKKEFELPDRRDLPLVKNKPANDLDDEFHTKEEPREYQIEIFHKARDHDAICYLPTGTGKTLVSAMLIDFMLEQNPWRPVLFIVDKVLLVLQQTNYLREQIGECTYNRYGIRRRINIAGMCGGKTDLGGCRAEDIDVLVATAGVIENLVQSKKIRWCDFCMIAIDEIHHCEKEHPYRRLVKSNHMEVAYEKRPKIFGMTASPAAEMTVGASLMRLRNLLRAIGNAKLCKVENSRDVLDQHQSHTTIEFVHAKMSGSERALQSVLQKHLLMCYRYVVQRSNIASLGIGIVISDRRSDDHNEFEFDGENLMRLRDGLELVTARPSFIYQVRNVLDHMYVVCSALMGLTICGDVAAYNVLKDLLESESPKGFESIAKLELKNDSLANLVRGNCTDLNVKGYVRSAIEKGQNMSAYSRLMEIILTRVNWASRREGKQPVVLILVKERGTAQFLTEILQGNDSLRERLIKVTALVGHGKGSGDGMTVAQQTRVLGGIRDYLYQIVVATSVAEEGLDLPSCDVVIELDVPGGITSLIQIRGRARQKNSSLFSICHDEGQETQIRRLLLNEKCMYRAIDLICEQQDCEREINDIAEAGFPTFRHGLTI